MILPQARAQRLGLGLGDVLAVVGAGGPVELEVVGIVERSFPGRTGEAVLVGWPDAEAAFGVVGADAFAIRYAPDARSTAAPAVAELATSYALTVAPISAVEGALGDALDRVFGLLDLLAVAALVIAGLGIVNTLSMDTWERVRELGVLRAAGMSRRQVWRSVLVEGGILGLIGSVVGSATGVVVGIVLVAASGGRHRHRHPPAVADDRRRPRGRRLAGDAGGRPACADRRTAVHRERGPRRVAPEAGLPDRVARNPSPRAATW